MPRSAHARALLVPLLALFTPAAPAAAQSLAVTPVVGAYVPVGDFAELGDQLRDFEGERERALALGVNVEVGPMRGTVRWVRDALVSRDGLDHGFDNANLLTASLDLVVRPLPRLLGVQPYLLGGIGLKRQDYQLDGDPTGDPFPSSESEETLHVGIGADFVMGGLGLVVEVDDSITRMSRDLGRHDAFVTVGLRLGI